MKLERGGGPSEEPERTNCEFGDLLIGAKFWFGDEQYIKLSVDTARLLGDDAPAPYRKFNEYERVRDIV